MPPADEIGLREAVAVLLNLVAGDDARPVGREVVPLPAALGRVVAEQVTAAIPQPPFDACMMDGWAVRSRDLAHAAPDRPVSLTMIGAAPAGHPFTGPVPSGGTVRVFTGAPVPSDCDAVVKSEDVAWNGEDGAAPRFTAPAAARRHIRPTGGDFAAGEVLIDVGTRLTSRHVALAASADRPWLTVHRRPRVGVLATGDEIALPGAGLAPGQLVSSNAPGLCALVARLGGEPVHLGVVADTVDAFTRAVAEAGPLDLLVTSGGTQAGDFDVVAKLSGASGGDTALENRPLALRPCKSVTVGRFLGVPMLGLPGNPVPTAIGGALLLAPMLRRLCGEMVTVDAPWPTRSVRLADSLPPPRGRTQVHAARVWEEDGVALTAPIAGRSGMAAMAAADHLIVIPPELSEPTAGRPVMVTPLL